MNFLDITSTNLILLVISINFTTKPNKVFFFFFFWVQQSYTFRSHELWGAYNLLSTILLQVKL